MITTTEDTILDNLLIPMVFSVAQVSPADWEAYIYETALDMLREQSPRQLYLVGLGHDTLHGSAPLWRELG